VLGRGGVKVKVKVKESVILKISSSLKEQWRSYHLGGCKILNLGDTCTCHLCLIDKLANIAISKWGGDKTQ